MRNTFSDEDVNAVARLISHDRFGPWKVEKLTFKKSSAKSLTYGFTSHGKEYVLKLYPTMARYVEKEMRALEICGSLSSVNLPVLVSFQLESTPYYLIYEKAQGIRLRDLTRPEILLWLPEVVRVIHEFSTVKLPHYGEIVGEYEGAPNTADLRAYTTAITHHWLAGIQHFLSASHRIGIDELATSQNITSALLSHSPTFTHSDLRLENLFVVDNSLTVIDFDNAFSFLPEFDLCKTFIDLQDCHVLTSMEEFSTIVAGPFGVARELAQRAMMRFYWFVALRKMHYYTRIGDFEKFRTEHHRTLRLYKDYNDSLFADE